jgi:PST family polysaccharide transporter
MLEIIKNIGWLFSEKVLRVGIILLVEVWIARYLGPEQFGALNLVIAFFMIFMVFGGLGLESIVVRDIVLGKGSAATLGTALALRFCGAALAIALTLAGIIYMRPDDHVLLGLAFLIAPAAVFKSFESIDLWFQSQVLSRYTVIATSAALMTGAAVKISLIVLKAPLAAFAAVVTLESALIAVGLLVAYKASGQSVMAWRFELGRAKELLSESWPLILSGVAVSVYMKIDQIMLAEMKGVSEVGIYSAAARLSEGCYFIPMIIVSSVFPAIVKSKTAGDELYNRLMQRLYDIMAWTALAVTVPVMLLSPQIISLFYGEAYRHASAILSIHILASVFVFLGVARNKWLVNEGLTRFTLLTSVAGAVLNVVMNLLLIPLYGGVGAAIATVVSYAVAVHTACFIHPRTRAVGNMMTKAIFVPVRAAVTRRLF